MSLRNIFFFAFYFVCLNCSCQSQGDRIPIFKVIDKLYEFDTVKFAPKISLEKLSEEDIKITLRMFKSNEVVGLLKGFEKGAVLNYPSGINESIKDYVDLTNRNIKSNPDKTKLNFRIFSPFHIDKETQVILYNVSIAYGERAGGWSSISIFKYKNDQWIEVKEYKYLEN